MDSCLKRRTFSRVAPLGFYQSVRISLNHLFRIGTIQPVNLYSLLDGYKTKYLVSKNRIATNSQLVDYIFQVIVNHQIIISGIEREFFDFSWRKNLRKLILLLLFCLTGNYLFDFEWIYLSD